MTKPKPPKTTSLKPINLTLKKPKLFHNIFYQPKNFILHSIKILSFYFLQMDFCIIEKWQHSPTVELFYNSLQRRLIFKKFNYLYSKGVDDCKSFPYIDLEDFLRYFLCSTPFLSCCFSISGKVLAFQRNLHDLVISNQEFLLLESNQHFVLYGKNKKILGYHWLSQTLYSDIVVITTNSIEFYKLFPKQSKILAVREYQILVGHYWASDCTYNLLNS